MADIYRVFTQRELTLGGQEKFVQDFAKLPVWAGDYDLYMSLTPSPDDMDRLNKWSKPIGDFRLFMKEVYEHPEDHDDYTWEETDFDGFCLGFLIAKGVDTLDAMFLSSTLRYNLQYFDTDPEIKKD